MKIGLVARADDRGLGVMTHEFYRAMHPDRTLVVREPGAEARGFVPHLDRYPDATVVRFDGGVLPEAEVRGWLHGLDAVYTAETFYDWRMVGWAAEAGVATVLHAMPEFYGPHVPAVTAVWAPTTWRLEHLPPDTRVVPVPVADDRFPYRPAGAGGRLQVLHVAGHRAAADRNGTLVLLQALRRCTQPMDVLVATQDARVPALRGHSRAVTVRAATGGAADYWELYAGQQVLVLPRKYGGLCLPAQEAMAAGLAVVMTDVEPQASTWPIEPVRARQRGTLATAAGPLPVYEADIRHLAACLDTLAADRERLVAHQEASVEWARTHTWDYLAPLYDFELRQAVRALTAVR